MRVLLTGWPSFHDGEATAGDVLSLDWLHTTLTDHAIPHETAWSPGVRPGAAGLDAAVPRDFTHLVFGCGPAHGRQVRRLHERFRHCRRIAVGVSVIDPDDPAVTGFHRVFARDESGRARPDLSGYAPDDAHPVVGVILAPGQSEYGDRRRHDTVHSRLTGWLGDRRCARVPLDTRLDPHDWTKAATPGQFRSILARMDAVVSTRLHGMVLALTAAVPVLAVDPVSGGGKVSAQAAALDWPALLSTEDVETRPELLERWWNWCLSREGRDRATAAGRAWSGAPPPDLVHPLLAELAT